MDRKISVTVSMPIWMVEAIRDRTTPRGFSAGVQDAIAAWLATQPGGDRDREKICA